MPTKYKRIGVIKDEPLVEALESVAPIVGSDTPAATLVQRTAMAAMRDLAALGPLDHRVPLPDLIIAAVAQENGLVVLHEDRHFEQLQRVMSFDAQRLLIEAPG
jgi:predicted nucleic acid-binding protein